MKRAISESRFLKRANCIHDETSIGRKYLILFRFRKLLTRGMCCQVGPKSALLVGVCQLFGFMRASDDWEQFYHLIQKAYPKKGSTLLLSLPEAKP